MLSEHEEKSYRQRTSERGRDAATPPHIFLFLLAFRILNALSIRTFFQPDEYFQSLEPAWEMAFGADSGAWVTWEWKYRLRSAIHPAIFAAVYRLSSFVSQSLQLSPSYHADLMITAPKVLQAVFAALGDYYTWKLGERMYGRGSNEAWAALALTVCSPWQWFCSTRTLSNCLETTLTIIALHSWPWHWSMKPTGKERLDENGLRTDERQGSWHSGKETHELAKLRRCLLLAATACVLRPTNLLIWICLTILSWFGPVTHGRPVPSQGFKATTSMRRSLPSLTRATKRERTILIREAFLCGSAILFLSAIIDRLYYRTWTFPPLRFLYYNLAQSLAVFYGRNAWHYYLTQGYPLLLTTILPFALIGLYQSLFPKPPSPPPPPSPAAPTPTFTLTIKSHLALTALLIPTLLSLISHKEVRFIYPLLPPLHLLASPPLLTFLSPSPRPSLTQYLLLPPLLLLTLLLALLPSTLHQPAPLTTLSYLRTRHHLSQSPNPTTIGFLTPCHSTPWRSHLVHPTIHAWALTCHPPISLPPRLRAAYLDEADRFYADPAKFLMQELGPPPRKTWAAKPGLEAGEPSLWAGAEGEGRGAGWDGKEGKKMWPEYLVFFEQMEATMRVVLRGSAYKECWRGWNSWGHEDWRRRGDMVVWCLDGRKAGEGVEGERNARRGGGRERGKGARRWWK